MPHQHDLRSEYLLSRKSASASCSMLPEVSVESDRTRLPILDLHLRKAKTNLKYNGEVPTYWGIVDLGIAYGYTVDGGDLAERVATKKVQKFSVTARQVRRYLGDVNW